MDRSWFHASITGVQAEKLLKNEGKHGSFLFRPSQSVSGSYCLSVRAGDSVTHVRVINDGDCFNLPGVGDEKFATLAELVRHYSEDNAKELRDTAGTAVELKYPLPCVDHHSERFFHHNVTGPQAEERMLSVASKPGTFLVRESQRQYDCFVLSVVVGKQGVKVLHVTITFQNGKYSIGDGHLFGSLSELVNFYRRNMMKDKSGIEVTLTQAVDLTQLKASEIDYRVAQLDKEFTLNGTQRSGFWEEFEHLQMHEHVDNRLAGRREENRKKNRYKNILPFDNTRVILTDVDPSVTWSDYINANFVQMPDESMPNGERRYIATQGCLHHTIPDFWLMAFQQESCIIVMITKVVEDGKNKCALYWPEGDVKSETYNIYQGTITVTLKEKPIETSTYYIKRIFEVVKQQHKGKSDEMQTQTRTFYHYQYLAWRDKRVPTATDTTVVLRFIEDVNSQWRAVRHAGPLVIHCSAGIGRTGTFIAIDFIINQINRKGLQTEIDIFKTILNIRKQRSGFVQTDLQYKFIYIAVKRYVELKKKPTALPSPLLDAEISPSEIYENVGDAVRSPPTMSPGPSTRPKPPSPGSLKPKPSVPTKPRKQDNVGGSSSSSSTAEAWPQNAATVYENLEIAKNASTRNS